MTHSKNPQGLVIETEAQLKAWTGDIDQWNTWSVQHGGPGFGPLDTARPVHPILRGEAAMALWRQGKDDWNAWVKRNPEAGIDFSDAQFEARPTDKDADGDPFISFVRFHFPKGNVDFFRAIFGEGHVYFSNATFGKGDVTFSDARLGKGDVDFRFASFGKGTVKFENLAFEGTARFTDLRNLDQCTLFSFEGCQFEKLFTFSLMDPSQKMGCPLDLRRTAMKHDVVVQDINCDYASDPDTTWQSYASQFLFRRPRGDRPTWAWRAKAREEQESQRFRKLKEIAVGNRNHQKALEFHTQEIQTSYGHGTTWRKNTAQFLYWALSDYGRSAMLPFLWLIGLWFAFASLFSIMAQNETESFWAAATLSRSNMLAFIPTGRSAMTQSLEHLFGQDVPYTIFFASGLQSLLAVILLFLLGLGLRNMFRV